MSDVQPRMQHPIMILPEAFRALRALSEATQGAGVPRETAYLMQLRASQINGCSFCVEMHSQELKDAGASDERVWAVAAWRETPYFSDAERAALALTEALTRLADRSEAVSGELWKEVSRHYDERALAALLIGIGSINVWNRLNAATHQLPAGARAAAAATA